MGVSTKVKAPNFYNQINKESHIEQQIINTRETIRLYRLSEIKKLDFSPQLLKEYLILKNTSNMEIVLAQFKLETGWFKSQSFMLYNNIAGMKRPKIRANLATGEGLGHASYDHWTDSVDDYFLWLDYHREKLLESDDYFDFLEKVGYSENGDYQKLLKQMIA